MVKRLRRSPLTAESGVRFPLGSPKKEIIRLFELFFFFVFLFFSFFTFHSYLSNYFFNKKEEIEKKNCGL